MKARKEGRSRKRWGALVQGGALGGVGWGFLTTEYTEYTEYGVCYESS